MPFHSLPEGIPGPPGPAGPGTFTEETSIVSVRDYGATGNGVTGDRDAIYNAIAAANDRELLFPAGTYRVESDLTFGSAVAVRFLNGARLSIDSGATVTINGPLEAGLYQIFSGDGLVNIGKGAVPMVYPQWWGAHGDGINDDTLAIQSAINTVGAAVGGVVFFAAGTYNFTGITIASDNITLEGQAREAVELNYTPDSGDAITLGNESNDADYFVLRNLGIKSANSSTGTAIASKLTLAMGMCQDFRIECFTIRNFRSGIILWTPLNGVIAHGRIIGQGHDKTGSVGLQLGEDANAVGVHITVSEIYIAGFERGFWNKQCPEVVMIRPAIESSGGDTTPAVQIDRPTTIIEGHWEANYGTGILTGDYLRLIGSYTNPAIEYMGGYGEARLWNEPTAPARSIAHRAYSAQSIPTGADTKIQLNAKTYDQYQGSWWDCSADYDFTVPYNAFYLLVGSVRYVDPEDQKVYTVRIKVNGTSVSEGQIHASGTSPISVQANAFRSLKAGDTIMLYTEHNSNGARDINYGADKTFLAIISL